MKYDAKSFYAYVRSRSKSRSGIGVLGRDDGVRVKSPRRWRRNLMSISVRCSVWRI